MLAPWKKSNDKPRQNIKKQRHYFVNKSPSSQSYGFSSSHVWMWELDCKESWAPKNWCFWTVVLEKTLESLLDCKETQPVNPKGNQYWSHWKDWYFSYLMQRTDSLEKTLILGKTEGRRRRGQQDEMVGWHHRLDGREFEHAPGVGEGQRLAWCSPWGCKELDTTKWLNWKHSIMEYLGHKNVGKSRPNGTLVERNNVPGFN